MGSVYLRNDVRYIHRYKHHMGRRLTSVELVQARPNHIYALVGRAPEAYSSHSVCLSVCVCVCVLFCSTFFSVTAMNSLSNESCNAITTQHSNAAKMSRFSLLGFAVNDSLW